MTAPDLTDGSPSQGLSQVAAAVAAYADAVPDVLDACSDADLLAEARLLETTGRTVEHDESLIRPWLGPP